MLTRESHDAMHVPRVVQYLWILNQCCDVSKSSKLEFKGTLFFLDRIDGCFTVQIK